MTFFTSDTHFNHQLIAQDRKFNSIEEHDNFIIDVWNKTVSKKDLVYHLGDFCFGGHHLVRKIRAKLNGKIILILGNHDYTNRLHNIKGIFSEIHIIKEIKINKIPTILCHFAMRVWSKSHYNSWQLYGHSHGKLPPIGKQWDVGLDNNNLKLYSEEEIFNILNKQPNNFNLIKNENTKSI